MNEFISENFILPAKQRLDQFLANKFANKYSRSKIKKLILDGCIISIDDKNLFDKIKPSLKVNENTFLQIKHPIEKSFELLNNSKSSELDSQNQIPILYQDDELAIIHKPAMMTVHPGAGTKDDTLVHFLMKQMKLSDGSENERPGIVHRLDRDTEGVMIIAKTNNMHRLLAEKFKNREIYKEYHAVVYRTILKEKNSIEGYISRDKIHRKKMKFTINELKDSKCKNANLDYQVILTNDFFSLIKIHLKTGRTHQIRATFSSLRHPVLSDTLYTQSAKELSNLKISKENKKIIKENELFLIANKIKFTHPTLNKEIDIDIKLPDKYYSLFKEE